VGLRCSPPAGVEGLAVRAAQAALSSPLRGKFTSSDELLNETIFYDLVHARYRLRRNPRSAVHDGPLAQKRLEVLA
jgi:hypothetical protein